VNIKVRIVKDDGTQYWEDAHCLSNCTIKKGRVICRPSVKKWVSDINQIIDMYKEGWWKMRCRIESLMWEMFFFFPLKYIIYICINYFYK